MPILQTHECTPLRVRAVHDRWHPPPLEHVFVQVEKRRLPELVDR